MHCQKGYSLVTALMVIVLLSGVTLAGWLVFNGQTSDAPTNPGNSIATFEQCVEAGYPVAESFPARCTVTDGKTFTEELDPDNKESAQLIKQDAQTKDTASRVITEALVFASNNNGLYPSLSDLQTSSELYQFPDAAFVARTPVKGEIQYQKSAQCSDDQDIQEANSTRSVAVRALLADGSYYCVDNQ